MSQKSLSSTIACALGSCIGAFLALEVMSRFQYGSYLWVIGALLGGVIAYITYDIQGFWRATARAYRETISWRPDVEYWKTFVIAWLSVSQMLVSAGVLVILFVVVPVSFKLGAPQHKVFSALLFIVTLYSVLISSIVFVCAFSVLQGWPNKKEARTAYIQASKQFNIFTMVWWIIAPPVKGIFYLVSNAPRLSSAGFERSVECGKAIKTFMMKTLVYTHSSRRMLCFADGAMGAAIGYVAGSSLVGLLIGAILGYIHYNMISVRLLKIAPENAK